LEIDLTNSDIKLSEMIGTKFTHTRVY